jgi:hypothetical protein
MKAMVLANEIVKFEVYKLKNQMLGLPINPFQIATFKSKLEAIKSTPAKLFMTSRPKLDKRRFRRHNRAMQKNSYIVRVNNDTQTD